MLMQPRGPGEAPIATLPPPSTTPTPVAAAAGRPTSNRTTNHIANAKSSTACANFSPNSPPPSPTTHMGHVAGAMPPSLAQDPWTTGWPCGERARREECAQRARQAGRVVRPTGAARAR